MKYQDLWYVGEERYTYLTRVCSLKIQQHSGYLSLQRLYKDLRTPFSLSIGKNQPSSSVGYLWSPPHRDRIALTPKQRRFGKLGIFLMTVLCHKPNSLRQQFDIRMTAMTQRPSDTNISPQNIEALN